MASTRIALAMAVEFLVALGMGGRQRQKAMILPPLNERACSTALSALQCSPDYRKIMKRTDALGEMTLAITVNIIAWCALYGTTWAPVFVYDDSYITLSNALALVGHANPYESTALAGSTSLIHVFVVAALALALPPETALGASCFIAGTLYLAGLLALGRAAGASLASRALVAILCSWAGLSMFHVYNGLETGLALAAICWSLTWMVQERFHRVLLVLPWLPWVRPELAALSALYLASMALRAKAGGTTITLSKTTWIMIACSTFLSALALLYSGVTPTATAAAKKNWFAEDCLPPEIKYTWLKNGLSGFSEAVRPIFIGAPLMCLTRHGRVGLIFIVSLIAVFYQKFPGGISHYDFRYLYLSTPFMLYGMLAMAGSEKTWTRRLGKMTILASAIATASEAPLHNIQRAKDGRDFTADHLAPAALAALAATDKSNSIAIHDAGYIGYAGRDARLVDIVGLKNSEVVGIHERLTHASCGRMRPYAVAEIIKTKKPTHLVVLRQWNDIFHISDSALTPGSNFTLTPIWADRQGYYVYRVDHRAP